MPDNLATQSALSANLISDSWRIKFSVRVKTTTYGDQKMFHEFRIVMRANGKIVGIEDGPRRTHGYSGACRIAGLRRVRELKTHQLFIVDVTKRDIDNGEGRSCESCAIAQALWRNQNRIGLSRNEFDFMVQPYGFMADCGGIVLENKHNYSAAPLKTGERLMPNLVSTGSGGAIYSESMYEWTSHWDDWADARYMTLKDWREEHPDDDCKPHRPAPCSFVLDLSEMKAGAQ